MTDTQRHPWGSNPHFTRAEKDAFQRRRIAIFDAGATAAREGRMGPAVFGGRDLGSFECITFYNGVMSVLPDFKHPYGGLGDPRRPAEIEVGP